MRICINREQKLSECKPHQHKSFKGKMKKKKQKKNSETNVLPVFQQLFFMLVTFYSLLLSRYFHLHLWISALTEQGNPETYEKITNLEETLTAIRSAELRLLFFSPPLNRTLAMYFTWITTSELIPQSNVFKK